MLRTPAAETNGPQPRVAEAAGDLVPQRSVRRGEEPLEDGRTHFPDAGGEGREDIAHHEPDHGPARGSQEAVDGAGLGREPFRETLPEPLLRGGDGELEPREVQDVVVVRQRRELHPPVRHELEERAGVRADVVQPGAELVSPGAGELVRHPAERVVLLENKNPFPAELRDRTGRGETAHARTDHDDVGFLVRDHPRPSACPSSGIRLAEPT